MNATKFSRFAEIRHIESTGLHYVRVESLSPEGHYTVVSHAPFSNQPCFDSADDALKFAESFAPEAIHHFTV